MNKKNSLGLRGKLILAILVVGAIPIALGLAVSYFKGTAQLQEVIGGSFEALAMNSASKVDGEIQQLVDANRILAQQAVSDPAVSNALEKLTFREGGDGFDWPNVDEEKGDSEILVRSWITGLGDVPADKKEVRFAGMTEPDDVKVDLFQTGEEEGRYVLSISNPIRKRIDGSIIGWFHRLYDAEKFLDSQIDPIRFGDTGHVMLIDDQGVVISCPLLLAGTPISDADLITLIAGKEAGWVNAESDGHGEKKASLIGHAPLKSLNRHLQKGEKSLFTFVWQDSEEIFAPMGSLQTSVALTGFLSLGLLGILGFYASNRIVNPIRRLSKEAGYIAEGDLNRTIDIRSGDEIEELADQFNHMTVQLRHLVDNLEDKVKDRTRELKVTQTEKDQVVKQLIQAEKIAAVGVLTSGIGHEINNPLYAILGRAEAIQDGAEAEQCREFGRDIVKNCKHISEIIKNLAGYVSPHSGDELESVDVNEKITEAAAMVRMSFLDDHIQIKEICNSVPKVLGRSQEIQQAFFNIIRNGAQAIEGRGTVEIESCLEGDRVRVSIKDNGPGISKENLGKIFDPFFTTKGPEAGEGLGLYIVQQTVKKNGGTLDVESQVGKGTVFNIEFPIGGKNLKEEAT